MTRPKHTKRVTPSLVLSIAAIVLATAGGAGATAVHLITGRDIKNHSIGLNDLSATAKQALRGKTGPQGPAGPEGAPGGYKATHEVVGSPVLLRRASDPQNGFERAAVDCPPGTVVTGGGWTSGVDVAVVQARMSGNGYSVIAINQSPAPQTLTATAICATQSA